MLCVCFFQMSVSKATVGTDLSHSNAASTVILGNNVVCGALLGCGFVQPGEEKVVSLQGNLLVAFQYHKEPTRKMERDCYKGPE